MEPQLTKQIVVREIPADLWRQLKIRAAEKEQTVQQTVTEAFEQYLQKTA